MRLRIIKSFFLLLLLLPAFFLSAKKVEANAPSVQGYVKRIDTNAGVAGVTVQWRDNTGHLRLTVTDGNGRYYFLGWHRADHSAERNAWNNGTFYTYPGSPATPTSANTTDASGFGCAENPHTFTVLPAGGDTGRYATAVLSEANGNALNNVDPDDESAATVPTLYYYPPIRIQGSISVTGTNTALSGVQVAVYDDTRQETKTTTTDASGQFIVDNFVRYQDGYSVRVLQIPSGYQSPPKTTKSGWSWQGYCSNNSDVPTGSASYECQTAGNNDCTNGINGYCNFSLDPVPQAVIRSVNLNSPECRSNGVVHLSWSGNYSTYQLRVDDPAESARPIGFSNTPGCSPHGVCVNDLTTTSVDISVDPTKKYTWWVHGDWNTASDGQPFQCSPDCNSLSGPSTIVLGNSANYSASFESNQGSLMGQIVWSQSGANISGIGGIQSFGGTTGSTTQTWSPGAAGTYTLLCRAWNDSLAECRGWSGAVAGSAVYTCPSSGVLTYKTVNVVAPTPTPTPVLTCTIQGSHVNASTYQLMTPWSGVTVDTNTITTAPTSTFSISGIPFNRTYNVNLANVNAVPSSFEVGTSICFNTTDPNGTSCHKASNAYYGNPNIQAYCQGDGYIDIMYHYRPKKGSITGNVFVDLNFNRAPDNEPAYTKGAQITLDGYDIANVHIHTTASVDGAGNFSFTNVNYGTYNVTISSLASDYSTTTLATVGVTLNSSIPVTNVSYGVYIGPSLGEQNRDPRRQTGAINVNLSGGVVKSISGLRASEDSTTTIKGTNFNNALQIIQNVSSNISDYSSNIGLVATAFVSQSSPPTNNTLSELMRSARDGNGFILLYSTCTCTHAGTSFTPGYWVYFKNSQGSWIWNGRFVAGTAFDASDLGLNVEFISSTPPSSTIYSVTFFKSYGDHSWGTWGYLRDTAGNETSEAK